MPGAFLWDDRVAVSASIASIAGTVATSMPVSNLLDPQPRLRTRWIGASASILVDYAGTVTADALALISTSLSVAATIRWRQGSAPGTWAFDTGTLDCQTGDATGGNVVLLPATQAVGRYLQVDVTDPGASVIDIGRLVSGFLWRPNRAFAYGVQEGRLILDRRDRNSFTGAEFPVPALVNPRVTRFALPLLTTAEITGQHRSMLRAMGAAGDALWIPDTALNQSELNIRSLWGAVAEAGAEALASRDSFTGSSRRFVITERV